MQPDCLPCRAVPYGSEGGAQSNFSYGRAAAFKTTLTGPFMDAYDWVPGAPARPMRCGDSAHSSLPGRDRPNAAVAYAGLRFVSTDMPGMKKFCSTWSV